MLHSLTTFTLLAIAIPHHTFRKLPPRQARKVSSKLRNRADHVIMPVNQSSSFRRFHFANYFPHFRKLPIPISRNLISSNHISPNRISPNLISHNFISLNPISPNLFLIGGATTMTCFVVFCLFDKLCLVVYHFFSVPYFGQPY